MLCWCRRAACSITFTTRHVAGRSFDGTKPALPPARNVICKCAASQCCCRAAFHCSRASNSSAVQSTLKVSAILDFFYYYCRLSEPVTVGSSETRQGRQLRPRREWIKKVYHSIYFHSHLILVEATRESTLTTFLIYSLDIFQFIFEFRLPSSAIKVLFNFSFALLILRRQALLRRPLLWLKNRFPFEIIIKRLRLRWKL